METVEEFMNRAIEHAPPATEPDPKLRGWWIKDGHYICSPCASRVMQRGVKLPEAMPVYRDRPEPYGVCCTCGDTEGGMS